MNLVPLSNKIVVKREDAEQTSAGGIVIPDVAKKEKPSRGKVLAVGPGKFSSETFGTIDNPISPRMPMEIKEGDHIVFARYGGQEIELDGQKLTVLSEDDVLAIIR